MGVRPSSVALPREKTHLFQEVSRGLDSLTIHLVQLVDRDLASDELRDLRDVIGRWEENQEDRRLIKRAWALYSDVEVDREQMINVADRDTN